MIGLYVSIGRQRGKRFEIAKERVTIGSDANNDLVLRDGGVAPFYGALIRVRDRWFLSTRETDARSSNRMRALEDGARLQVGDYTVVLAAAPRKPARLANGTSPEPLAQGTSPPDNETPTTRRDPPPAEEPATTRRDPSPSDEPATVLRAPSVRTDPELAAALARVTVPMAAVRLPELPPTEPLPGTPQPEPTRDPIEQALIDAIVAGDEAGRLVYADWLEGRGDTLRAEFLRLQRALDGMEPTDPAQAELLKERMRRLGELAPKIDFAWRRMLGRPAVEGCRKVVADFKCKMEWGSLAATDKPNVRRCGACGDDVYFVTNIRAARAHVRVGHCIVVDFKQARRPGDLEQDEEQVLAMRTPRRGPIPFFPFQED